MYLNHLLHNYFLHFLIPEPQVLSRYNCWATDRRTGGKEVRIFLCFLTFPDRPWVTLDLQ
jgi:hypothetical protein